MATINVAAVTAAVNSAVGGSIGSYIDEAGGLAKANALAGQLANCINDAMYGSLSGGEASAVGAASSAGASSMGGGIYKIGANIPFTFRPSLWQDGYGFVDDMAALFNNGYGGGGTYGVWHGTRIKGRPSRPGKYFVQTGVNIFVGEAGVEVLDYNIDGRFTG